jgi:formylmethanofuran dehydrogenase subunit E
MSCTIPNDRIKETIAFHGHVCPGLSYGIRAAELCLSRLGANTADNPVVAVVETDMCGVDAIQFLTGCTFGKGNLIHRDLGKMAFSFYSRATNEGFRAVIKPYVLGELNEEMRALMRKPELSPEERSHLAALRRAAQERIMTAPIEDIFEVGAPRTPCPRPASILESLACEDCGERTMESRTRRFSGRTLCIPCFNAVEQKM